MSKMSSVIIIIFMSYLCHMMMMTDDFGRKKFWVEKIKGWGKFPWFIKVVYTRLEYVFRQTPNLNFLDFILVEVYFWEKTLFLTSRCFFRHPYQYDHVRHLSLLADDKWHKMTDGHIDMGIEKSFFLKIYSKMLLEGEKRKSRFRWNCSP